MSPTATVLEFPGGRSLKSNEHEAEQVLVEALIDAQHLSEADARCVARRFMTAAAPLCGHAIRVDLPELNNLPSTLRAEVSRGVQRALDETATQVRDLFLWELLRYELWLWRVGAETPPKDAA
jgi:hypothetical protein